MIAPTGGRDLVLSCQTIKGAVFLLDEPVKGEITCPNDKTCHFVNVMPPTFTQGPVIVTHQEGGQVHSSVV